MAADIAGLPQNIETGFFGFHVHEGNACAGTGFSQTDSFYRRPRHAGDLLSLMMQQDSAHPAVRTDRFRVQNLLR